MSTKKATKLQTSTAKLQFLVHSPGRRLVAAFGHPSDAAILVAALGRHTTIATKDCGVLWIEGEDGSAAESYDVVAETVIERARVARTAAAGAGHAKILAEHDATRNAWRA